MASERIVEPSALTSVEGKLIGVALNAMQSDVGEVKTELRSITEALAHLTRLETEHLETRSAMQRAFGEIGRCNERLTVLDGKTNDRITDIDKRVQAAERILPGLVEARRWVVGLGIGAVSMLLVALASLVLSSTAKTQQATQATVKSATP